MRRTNALACTFSHAVSSAAISFAITASAGAGSGLIAADSFTYNPAGANLNGYRPGGTGWTAGWLGSPAWTVTEPGMTYASGDATLATEGNAITSASAVGVRTLAIDQPLGDTPGTIWLSLLAERLDGAGGGTYLGLNLLAPGGTNPLLFVGQPFNQVEWGIDGGLPGTVLTSGTSSTVPSLLVLRIDFNEGADDIWLWINPDLALEPSTEAADVAAPGLGDFSGISQVRVDVGSGAGGGAILGQLDELRIGLNFQAIAPQAGGANCFEAHATPGCDDPSCEFAVCSLDPFCCEVQWDLACVQLADATCTVAIPPLPCCANFQDGTTMGFGPCPPPAHNVTVSVTTPGPSGPTDLYLRIEDEPNGSAVCGTFCPGDWLTLAQDECAELCFDVQLFDDGTPGSTHILVPPRIYIRSGSLTATFVGTPSITEPGGTNPGWHHYCAPLYQSDPAALPSGPDGAWTGVTPAQWNTLLSNVTQVLLPVDFTSYPAEIIGYDNICLSAGDSCPCATIVDAVAECKWAGGIFTVKITLRNDSDTVAHTAHLAPVAGTIVPNPVLIGGPDGLAPGEQETIELTFCLAPLSGAMVVELFDANGAPICDEPEVVNIPFPKCDSCEVLCDSANINEGEPCFTNTVNRGCDVPAGTAPQFQQLACGDTLCAKTWAGPTEYDTDWFIVELPDENGDGWSQLCLTWNSNTPLTCEVYSGSCGVDLELLASRASTPCLPETLCICLPAPSKYKLRMLPGCPPCGPIFGDVCSTYLLDVACDELCECTPPPPGMHGWWTLDELVGNTASNSVCGAPICSTNGIWFGSPQPTPGIVGSALEFTTPGNYVAVPAGPDLHVFQSDFTIDAWIRWNPPANPIPLSLIAGSSSGGGSSGFMFRTIACSSGNSAMLRFETGPLACQSGCVIPAHEWVHVAATLEANQPDGCKLYVNGQVVAQQATAGPYSPIVAALFIGASPATVFKGAIDELETFKRALAASEIESIFLAGCAGKCKTRLKVPALADFCGATVETTITTNLWNDGPLPNAYQLGFGPSTALTGCNGPPIGSYTFTVLPPYDTPSVVVPGNTCVPIKVKVNAPPGLACGQASCYRMCATNVLTSAMTCSEGKLGRSCSFWWWINEPWDGTLTPICCPIPSVFEVENLGDVDGSLPYQLSIIAADTEAPPPISLNGLPPGVPATGVLSAPPGSVASGTFTAEFLEPLPFSTYDVLIEADADNDGVLEVIGIGSLSFVSGGAASPCPSDLDGDGTVGGADLGALLGAWGTAGPIGDINDDGTVNGADLGALLGAWGPCL